MSYRDIIGIIENNPNSQFDNEHFAQFKGYNDSLGYDPVRLGLPDGVLDFDRLKGDREILISHFISCGYSTWPSKKIDRRFAKHVALFRASLDIYEEFSSDQVFTKSELYYRSLSEGAAFTDYIKKCRATCLRAYSAETDTEVEEEFFCNNYTGYNSIIHERYLLHWDARKDALDYPFSLMPDKENPRDIKIFEGYLDKMFKEFRLDEVDKELELDMLKGLQPTKMYDSNKKKTFLMREFWNSDIDMSGPYFAKRVVVPIEPGNIRDAGVGDPGSVLKVKILNMMARRISDKLPHSANTDGPTANARYKRVLKKNSFLHLDFKKYGLTAPRSLMNAVIRRLGKTFEVDTKDLEVNEFYLELEDRVIKTNRGSVLGWLDPIMAIGISAILCHLSSEEGLNFDHIGFNDDFELSKRSLSDVKGTLELLRIAVITEMHSWDIPISINKTYGSKASVFLERYCYYQREYDLDMYKEQLTVKAYARSLVTTNIYQAKLFFAAAWEWTKNDYVRDRCIDTCPIEFRKEEITLPLWAGGWTLQNKNGMDYSFENSDRLGIRLGLELSKFKPKRYSNRLEHPSSHAKIVQASNNKAWNADSAELEMLRLGFTESVDKINEETEWYASAVRTLADIFEGRDKLFPEAVVRVVLKATRAMVGD